MEMDPSKSTEKAAENIHGGKRTPKKEKKKSLRGPMQLIRVAFYLLRLQGSKSEGRSKKLHSARIWRRLVGSVRRMPLDAASSSLQQPLPMLPPNKSATTPPPPPPPEDRKEVVASSPLSPLDPISSASSTSSVMLSARSSDNPALYSSIESLHELDPSSGDDDEESGYDDEHDGSGGDEMIDARAEEFIAKFYAQMRMQNQAYNSQPRRI